MEETASKVVTSERFRVERTLEIPASDPKGLAWDGNHLWVSDGAANKIHKLDVETGQPVLTIPFDGEIAGTAWDGSHLWQVDNRTKTVSQIDPENGSIAMALACDPGEGVLGGLCFDGNDLWLAVTGAGQLRRIRTKDGAIVKIHPAPTNIVGIGYDRRRMWYTEHDDHKVRLLDPATGTELMSYSITEAPVGIAFIAHDRFWYAQKGSNTLTQYVYTVR